MNRNEFLTELKKSLLGLPEEDIQKSIDFYSEMIDDRTEDGISEEDAVAALGSIDEIRSQILKDMPLQKIVKERIKPKRTVRSWEIALLIIGAPLWLPLMIAAASVIFSVYIVLWSVIVVLYSADLCFFAGALAGILCSIPAFIMGNIASGLLLIGTGLICAGLGVLWLFLCIGTTKGIVWLTKVFIKSLFIRKGDK